MQGTVITKLGRGSTVISLLVLGLCLSACSDKPASLSAAEPQAASVTSIIIGTYTSPAEDNTAAASEGLYGVNYNSESMSFGQISLLSKTDNPSFGVFNRQSQGYYSVDESEQGRVTAYQWEPTGQKLSLINTVDSEGKYPCYIALSPDGQQLAVANYVSGNIAVYQLDPVSGAIKANPQVFQHSGQGPNLSRQEGPHAHWIQWYPDGNYLYAVDLGIDKIMVYPVDRESKTIQAGHVALALPAGAGPRHMVFHPSQNRSYILNELNNTVSVASIDAGDGSLSLLQTLSTLPSGFQEASQAGHIAMSRDGSTLYVSNRGHNSVAVFNIAADGTLEQKQFIATEGRWPRHFLLLEQQKMMLIANKDSNNITVFNVLNDGQLAFTGKRLSVTKPVFLAPLGAQ